MYLMNYCMSFKGNTHIHTKWHNKGTPIPRGRWTQVKSLNLFFKARKVIPMGAAPLEYALSTREKWENAKVEPREGMSFWMVGLYSCKFPRNDCSLCLVRPPYASVCPLWHQRAKSCAVFTCANSLTPQPTSRRSFPAHSVYRWRYWPWLHCLKVTELVHGDSGIETFLSDK